MKEKVLVEVCCGSLEDVIIAKKAGAHRVELNSNMFLGGITPSIGTIEEAKALVDIPVMVMIRPRGAGFCYSEYEIKTMERDMKAAVEAGVAAVEGMEGGNLYSSVVIARPHPDLEKIIERYKITNLMP